VNHHVVDPAGLARLHFDLAGERIALVDDAERGNAFGHRRALPLSRQRSFSRRRGLLQFFGNLGLLSLGRWRGRLASASHQRERQRQRGQTGRSGSHASGVQAS
tara:strand:+ start:43937 stop:44248 length:312 start_codon:yes stop_codon:yes gene_type:complete